MAAQSQQQAAAGTDRVSGNATAATAAVQVLDARTVRPGSGPTAQAGPAPRRLHRAAGGSRPASPPRNRSAPISVGGVRTLHAHWVWVALVTNGAAGLWGLGLAIARRVPRRPFWIGVGAAAGAMLVQVALGFAVYAQGLRPGSDYHLFYGFLVLFTVAFAYIFRAAIARRPALAWGLLLLFTTGLGIRAWATVAG